MYGVIFMKRVNRWVAAAGVALALIMGLTVFYMAHPGRFIEIPLPEEERLPPAETVFVTPDGKKFHREGCSATAKSETLWQMTPDAAEADGYEACQKCKPR